MEKLPYFWVLPVLVVYFLPFLLDCGQHLSMGCCSSSSLSLLSCATGSLMGSESWTRSWSTASGIGSWVASESGVLGGSRWVTPAWNRRSTRSLTSSSLRDSACIDGHRPVHLKTHLSNQESNWLWLSTGKWSRDCLYWQNHSPQIIPVGLFCFFWKHCIWSTDKY